jgi:KaiC/GvpD/RAD55 family RecA-like ATPase
MIKNEEICNRLAARVKSTWFVDPFVAKAWIALTEVRKRLGRHPTLPELKDCPELVAKEEAKTVQNILTAIDASLTMSTVYGWDFLEPQLVDCERSRVFHDFVYDSATDFNAGRWDVAYKKAREGITKLDEIDAGRITGALDAAPETAADFVARVSQLAAEKPAWIAEPFLPEGAFVAIGGEPGSLKTWFLFYCIKRACEAGKRVHYVTNESSERDIANRLSQIFGPDLPATLWIRHGGSVNLLSDESTNQLLTTIQAAGGADLLILDPLSNLVSGLDENEAAAMSLVRDRILLLQRRLCATVVLVMHTKKDAWNQCSPELSWFRGSSVWGGSIDMGLITGKGKVEGNREHNFITCVKSKSWTAIPPQHRFAMETVQERTTYSVSVQSADAMEILAALKLKEKAKELIGADPGITKKRLQDAMGTGDDHTKKTVIQNLVDDGTVKTHPGANRATHHVLAKDEAAWLAQNRANVN